MNNKEIKVGDIVRVPEAIGHEWTANQGKVVLVSPPFCRVLLRENSQFHNIAFKVEDVKKM